MSVSLIPIVICPIKSVIDHSQFIHISAQLAERLSINKNQHIKMCIGKNFFPVQVQIVEITQNEIHLSEYLIKELSLPIQKHRILASFKEDISILQFGPIIGLLTDFTVGEDGEPDFRSVHSFCEELHHGVSELGGLFYVYQYRDFTDQSVKGYYFEDGKWILTNLPLPDVTYNRIHSRKIEKTTSFKAFRKKLKKLNIPLFNDRFLSKWEVYEQLIQDEKIMPNIPETQILSKDNLEQFLNKYSTVFIKPVNGSQGRHIIKLFKEKDYIHYQTTQNSELDSIKNKSIDEVFHQLKPLLHNRIFIVQQGVSLASYESRSMDFRALCHRNTQDLWEVTSLIARVAAETQFVSNLAKGGETIKPLTTLVSIFDKKKAKEIILSMKILSIEAASVVSAYSTGITGELGIDIGVDQTGNLWLIEINSKPSKNFEGTDNKIRPSAKAIIRFCTKLAFDID
ncbi:MAG: YheC/YheD family protein [Bacillota bacterium]|nr:YheC/YheD family protein [Bacillota bacterium]